MSDELRITIHRPPVETFESQSRRTYGPGPHERITIEGTVEAVAPFHEAIVRAGREMGLFKETFGAVTKPKGAVTATPNDWAWCNICVPPHETSLAMLPVHLRDVHGIPFEATAGAEVYDRTKCPDCDEPVLDVYTHACIQGQTACEIGDHRFVDVTAFGDLEQRLICVRVGCGNQTRRPFPPVVTE